MSCSPDSRIQPFAGNTLRSDVDHHVAALARVRPNQLRIRGNKGTSNIFRICSHLCFDARGRHTVTGKLEEAKVPDDPVAAAIGIMINGMRGGLLE